MDKPTDKELKQGYQECKCGKLLLLEAGFEVNPYFCNSCECYSAKKEEFFNAPVKILSK